MVTAQVLHASETVHYDVTKLADRQAMMDSVLGTMNAEGEPPSDGAQAVMRRFVAGEISLDEMSQLIIEHATRTVHEANAHRLAVR